MNPLVSIIIPVKNEGHWVKRTIDSINQAKSFISFEIIVVDDQSTDGCCDFIEQLSAPSMVSKIKSAGVGAPMARNIGASHAKGKYLIFCDAHVLFENHGIDALIQPLQSGASDAVNPVIADFLNRDRRGYGQTWDSELNIKWNPEVHILSPTPLLAGGCLAISANVFFDIGGFDHGFKVWGHEDEELSIRLWLFGYRCCIQPSTTVYHVFRQGSTPFQINWDDVNYNFARMALSHFSEERLLRCKKIIKHSNAEEIWATVLKGDILDQRERYFNKRMYDDQWFMNRFKIQF